MKSLITRLFPLFLLVASTVVEAQTYPNKPIRWVVPYTGGGITDVVTRVVTQKIQSALGQPIIVDNRPGANSILGSDLVAKAPPDGYTMLTVIAGYAANVTLYQGKLPFDPAKSLVPVSLAGIAPLILTANANFPAKDVKELIAYAKANPGKVNFGSSGIGAAAHLTTELLKQTAGIDMVHIPYKGTAPALTAEMANDIQILVDVPSTLMPHVRGGKIKALAMFSKERIKGAPEVPTIAEAGGPAARVLDLGAVHGARRHAQADRRSPRGGNREGDQRVGDQDPLQRHRHHCGRQHPGAGAAIPRRRGCEVGQGHQYGRREGGAMKSVLIFVVGLAISSIASAQPWPSRTHPLHRPLPAGRVQRHARAHARDRAAEDARPAGDRGKPAGRQHHSRAPSSWRSRRPTATRCTAPRCRSR